MVDKLRAIYLSVYRRARGVHMEGEEYKENSGISLFSSEKH
jgi:hypothetical protein